MTHTPHSQELAPTHRRPLIAGKLLYSKGPHMFSYKRHLISSLPLLFVLYAQVPLFFTEERCLYLKQNVVLYIDGTDVIEAVITIHNKKFINTKHN